MRGTGGASALEELLHVRGKAALSGTYKNELEAPTQRRSESAYPGSGVGGRPASIGSVPIDDPQASRSIQPGPKAPAPSVSGPLLRQ